jgi:hypothetical protein
MEVTTTEIGQVGEADRYTIKCSFKRYDEQEGALRTHSRRKLFPVTMLGFIWHFSLFDHGSASLALFIEKVTEVTRLCFDRSN